METTPQNRNVFAARLTQYMITHHPDRIKDNDFITERASGAAKVFENLSMAGLSVEESMVAAEHSLFEGLLFSPYAMVRELVLTELDYTEEDEDLEEFTLQMLEMVQPLIVAHQPDDNFQGSNDYPVLYDEIKQSINQYLVRNGIQ